MLPSRLPLKGYPLWGGHYQSIFVFGFCAAMIVWSVAAYVMAGSVSDVVVAVVIFTALLGIPIWAL
jgi:hypothetical protein